MTINSQFIFSSCYTKTKNNNAKKNLSFRSDTEIVENESVFSRMGKASRFLNIMQNTPFTNDEIDMLLDYVHGPFVKYVYGHGSVNKQEIEQILDNKKLEPGSEQRQLIEEILERAKAYQSSKPMEERKKLYDDRKSQLLGLNNYDYKSIVCSYIGVDAT